MSEVKDINISEIKFSSTVFPSEEDMKLWSELSAEEQRAVIARDLDAAEASGIAPVETAQQIIECVRAQSTYTLSGTMESI